MDISKLQPTRMKIKTFGENYLTEFTWNWPIDSRVWVAVTAEQERNIPILSDSLSCCDALYLKDVL